MTGTSTVSRWAGQCRFPRQQRSGSAQAGLDAAELHQFNVDKIERDYQPEAGPDEMGYAQAIAIWPAIPFRDECGGAMEPLAASQRMPGMLIGMDVAGRTE